MSDLKINHANLSSLASEPVALEQVVQHLLVCNRSMSTLVAEVNDQEWFVTFSFFQIVVKAYENWVVDKVSNIAPMSPCVSSKTAVVTGVGCYQCTIKEDNLSACAKFWEACSE
jgi:hypothetical protein